MTPDPSEFCTQRFVAWIAIFADSEKEFERNQLHIHANSEFGRCLHRYDRLARRCSPAHVAPDSMISSDATCFGLTADSEATCIFPVCARTQPLNRHVSGGNRKAAKFLRSAAAQKQNLARFFIN